MMNNTMTCRKIGILRYTLSILMTTICLTLTAAPAGAQDELLHDSMHQGAHPEFKWYTTLVSWRFSLDGFVSGLPDIGFRSAIISGISFDESADTFMVIARIDRNDVAMYYIGYTDIRPDFHNYSHKAITCGIYVDSLGTISPSWDAGNEEYWGASLPEGIYDLRIMIDRVNSGMTVAFDPVPAYDAPLSSFDSPVLSITEHVDLAEILYIQMNLYNQSSAVFDVWSTEGTPSLLRIDFIPDIVIVEGDSASFTASAEYDGEKPLAWTFDDSRFFQDDSIYTWGTKEGDCGIYQSELTVTDGHLADTFQVNFSITQAYDSMLRHDRMNGLPGSPHDWVSREFAVWYTAHDGYLQGRESREWTSAALSKREESLEELRSWVFRIIAGDGRRIAFGLTEIPPKNNSGYFSNLQTGVIIDETGRVTPTWYSTNTQFEETVLPGGLYDFRITWDPAIEEARFEAVPVDLWIDSLSTFSEAVWTTYADVEMDPPAYVQINVIGGNSRVYDLWSYSPLDGPRIVEEYSTEAGPTGIELMWAVSDNGETGEFVILRCPEEIEGCRELARIPLIEGMTSYGYGDEDVAPGSSHNYRVYLDRGLGMEMLFETGLIEVPVAPASLNQNYPNPFNPGTRIGWYLPSSSKVRIMIFDLTGRPVRTLVDNDFEAGASSVDWDGASDSGTPAASGVYFYRIEAGSFTDSKKMVLLR